MWHAFFTLLRCPFTLPRAGCMHCYGAQERMNAVFLAIYLPTAVLIALFCGPPLLHLHCMGVPALSLFLVFGSCNNQVLLWALVTGLGACVESQLMSVSMGTRALLFSFCAHGRSEPWQRPRLPRRMLLAACVDADCAYLMAAIQGWTYVQRPYPVECSCMVWVHPTAAFHGSMATARALQLGFFKGGAWE